MYFVSIGYAAYTFEGIDDMVQRDNLIIFQLGSFRNNLLWESRSACFTHEMLEVTQFLLRSWFVASALHLLFLLFRGPWRTFEMSIYFCRTTTPQTNLVWHPWTPKKSMSPGCQVLHRWPTINYGLLHSCAGQLNCYHCTILNLYYVSKNYKNNHGELLFDVESLCAYFP